MRGGIDDRGFDERWGKHLKVAPRGYLEALDEIGHNDDGGLDELRVNRELHAGWSNVRQQPVKRSATVTAEAVLYCELMRAERASHVFLAHIDLEELSLCTVTQTVLVQRISPDRRPLAASFASGAICALSWLRLVHLPLDIQEPVAVADIVVEVPVCPSSSTGDLVADERLESA